MKPFHSSRASALGTFRHNRRGEKKNTRMRKLLWKKRYWSTYFKCFPSQWILYFRPSSACWVWLLLSYDPGCCHLSARSILSDPVSLRTDGTQTHTMRFNFHLKKTIQIRLLYSPKSVWRLTSMSLFSLKKNRLLPHRHVHSLRDVCKNTNTETLSQRRDTKKVNCRREEENQEQMSNCVKQRQNKKVYTYYTTRK